MTEATRELDIPVLEEKERLCLAGIGVIELYADGMATADMPFLSIEDAAEQLEGVILYTLILEAIIASKGGFPAAELREAARSYAAVWRTRVPTDRKDQP